jgi:hypothetical protein
MVSSDRHRWLSIAPNAPPARITLLDKRQLIVFSFREASFSNLHPLIFPLALATIGYWLVHTCQWNVVGRYRLRQRRSLRRLLQ